MPLATETSEQWDCFISVSMKNPAFDWQDLPFCCSYDAEQLSLSFKPINDIVFISCIVVNAGSLADVLITFKALKSI